MPLIDKKYKRNQTLLKVYGYGDDLKIKVVTMNILRTSGIEDESGLASVRCSVNDTKLEESIIRAKNKIFELAFCNPWQYFFTGTLNPKFYDRTNLTKYHKDLTQWIRDQGKKLNCKIDFLLIPELHADGKSWHIHGFINGLPDTELQQFKVGDKMGSALSEKVLAGDTVYNWLSYQNKFGFCDLEPIRNSEAVSKYVTKYINKNLAESVTDLNSHLYYHSRGLKSAITVKRGTMLADIEPTFQNEHCSISWLDYSDELLQGLVSAFL